MIPGIVEKLQVLLIRFEVKLDCAQRQALGLSLYWPRSSRFGFSEVIYAQLPSTEQSADLQMHIYFESLHFRSTSVIHSFFIYRCMFYWGEQLRQAILAAADREILEIFRVIQNFRPTEFHA